MRLSIGFLGAVAALALSAAPALAQKSGGVLKMYFADNPPSTSIHEEATTSTVVPFMGLYNNLVVFDQQIPQNSLESIRPDLAESWAWSEDGKKLTFKLVGNAKWHDGKPFTSADVKCTWDMLTGKSKTQKLRKNPRISWYWNLQEVTTNGDREVTFHLGQPQPSLLILLASGYSPVYSCHVPTAQMRTKPIGTGPFKLAEFKQKEIIKLTRNTDYFKKGKPYLDGIEMPIVPARGTALLGFVSGRYDMTPPYAVTIPLLKDIKAQAANAICEVAPMNNSTNLIVNSEAAPFNNADIRRAMLLTIDRKSFIDILAQGAGEARCHGTSARWCLGHAQGDVRPGEGLRSRRRQEPRRRPGDHEEAGLRPGQPAEAQGLDA
jgi:peptide/nickel transport system substrate-binding protein